MSKPNYPFAIALAITSNVIGGATYFGIKHALLGLPEFSIAFLRTAVAVAVLVPFMRRGEIGATLRGIRRDWGPMLLLGAIGNALPTALGNVALRFTTAMNASLLIGIEPICIAVFSALFLGEYLSRPRVLALMLGILGGTLIVGNGIPFLTVLVTPHLKGDLLVVAHGMAWAVYSIAAKPLLRRHSPMAVTVIALAVALPFLFPPALYEFATTPQSPQVVSGLVWAVGLGIGGSALASLLWNFALEHLDASHNAGFVFVQPLTGVLLGWLFLGESLSAFGIAGGVLILGGVYLLMRSPKIPPLPA